MRIKIFLRASTLRPSAASRYAIAPKTLGPNIDYELYRHSQHSASTVRFNAEARRAVIRFATSLEAPWIGNFCEPSAAITRMATLADGSRIAEWLVIDVTDRHIGATR